MGMSRSMTEISEMMQSDAVIFAETLDILLGALEVLNEESKPLRLRLSWVKTKMQAESGCSDVLLLHMLSSLT